MIKHALVVELSKKEIGLVSGGNLFAGLVNGLVGSLCNYLTRKAQATISRTASKINQRIEEMARNITKHPGQGIYRKKDGNDEGLKTK